MPIDAPFVAAPVTSPQFEGLVLNGLNLNTGPGGGVYSLEALDMTPPPKLPEWAKGADSDGQALVRTPLFDNRTITFQLRIENVGTMDLALTALGAVVDQIQEAEKQPDGSPLVWTPADGTRSITFYVLTGSVTGMPLSVEQTPGWFIHRPVVTVSLTCKPFGYGTEVAGSSASSGSAPVATVTIPSVAGDVPAEGRLVVTDASSTNRGFVEWGLQQRYYDPATSLGPFNSFTLTGTGGSFQTLAGSYSANVVYALLGQTPTAVAATPALGHVGTFRVRARVYASSMAVQPRLSWADGDGTIRANPWATLPQAGTWADVDLGIVTITPASSGAQKWTGRLDAQSAASGDSLRLDYLLFIPAGEGYGKARAVSTGSGVLVASDNAQGASGNLNGRVPQIGQTWITTGASGDFTQNGTSFERSAVSDASPRFGTFCATQTDTQVFTEIQEIAASSVVARSGVLARYVNTTNYMAAYVDRAAGFFVVQTWVAGVLTGSWSTAVPTYLQPAIESVQLYVYASGAFGAVLGEGGVGLYQLFGFSPDCATGGALASGKAGIYDQNPSSTVATRYWSALGVAVPPAQQVVCYANRPIEFRSDETVRQDSTGTYYGRPSSYRGSRFYVPQAGSAGRTARILVRAEFSDIETGPNSTITAPFTVQPFWTPRFHVIPR